MALHVALVGGTGFIGTALSRELRGRGANVRLVARRAPDTLADGETFAMADTSDSGRLRVALEGVDVVVHLVAVLAERGVSFGEIIRDGAKRTAEVARAAGVRRMVYVSALGADEASESGYARAKAEAEVAVRGVFGDAVVVRPSLVMGDGGGFRRQVDLLTRVGPVMVLPGWGRTRFQPVEVEVLAKVLADACLTEGMTGRTVEAVGPDVLSFEELAGQELARLGRKRLLLPLPWWVTELVARGMAWADRVTGYRVIPDWLLVTPDQVRLLRVDNIGSDVHHG